jgi:hypothetical protein
MARVFLFRVPATSPDERLALSTPIMIMVALLAHSVAQLHFRLALETTV